MFEYPNYLIHYGIEGQKWGVRRFQNEDGTYTSEGLERRRALIENGAHPLSREVRKATREGDRAAKYNLMLAANQNRSNRKFDKYSSKLETQKSKGLNPSEKTIKKTIKYGTEVRKADYIAKDPQQYYDRMRKIETMTNVAGIPGGALTSLVSGIKYNKYYANVFEKARNETIADLKKRKLI